MASSGSGNGTTDAFHERRVVLYREWLGASVTRQGLKLMAARLTKGTKDVPWSEQTRQRIKTSMLLNRLHNHVFKDAKVSQTQLKAIDILLAKTLPNLSAVEHHGELVHSYALVLDQSETAEAWEQQLPANIN